MQYGYQEDTIEDTDYRYGQRNIATASLVENGQWDGYLPADKELQSTPRFESSACVTFGTHNVLEMLYARKYGELRDFSERYTAKRTNTTPAGNSPQKVIEQIRKYIGLVPEVDLPFTHDMDWDDFYSGITCKHKRTGATFLKDWKIQHEWVEGNQVVMMDALRFSPLGVAVNAWARKGDLYVRKGGDNHWCVIYGFEKDKYWKVLDTYTNTFKRLAWDYGFFRVKRYSVSERKGLSLKSLYRMALGGII